MSSTSTWLAPIVHRSRRIGLPLVGTVGIAVSTGAFLTPEQFHSAVAVSVRDSGGPWPDWLFAAVIALCSAALLLLFGLFMRLYHRRRAADPDAYEELFEPPPVSPATAALLLVTTALLIIITVRALWPSEHGTGTLAGTGKPLATERVAATLPALGHAVTHSPLAGIAVAMAALLAAAFAFAFVWWLHFGGTHLRSVSSPDRMPGTLRQAVDESADALRSGRGPTAAIIACYAGFERSLASLGLARAPWETTNEFAHRASRQFRLPVDAVGDLAHLFELARFSGHSLDEHDREAAWQALDAVKAVLNEGVVHAWAD